MVGLLGLFVLLFFLLHTAPGKELSRSVFVNTVSALSDSDASLGHLDYRLWHGEITLSDLTLRSESFDLEVARIELGVSPTLQISADVRGPRLDLRFVPDGEMDAESEPWTGLPVSIRHIQLTDGHVRVEYEDANAWLEVGGIGIQLDEGRLAVEGKELPLEPLEATLEWKGSEILLEQARVGTGSSEVRMRGVLSPSPLTASLALDFQLDAELMGLWVPDWHIAGRVDGRARLEVNEDRLRVEGDFRSEDFDFQEIGTWKFTGKVKLEDGVLELAPVALVGYGGTGELEARIALRDNGRSEFHYRFNNLDLGRLTKTLTGLEPPFNTRVHSEATLSVTDWQMENAEGQGSIRLLQRSGAKEPSQAESLSFL